MQPSDEAQPIEHKHAFVHEAIGPDLPGSQAAAAIALGVVSLLMAGVLPMMLGALADEGRLSAQNIGLTATFEALAMGLTTGTCGIFLKPRFLRSIGAGAALLLAVVNFTTLGAHGTAVMAIRLLAGIPEGVLLWITIGMIARTRTPERWAGTFFTALTAGQLALALLFQQWVLPKYGADGGFAGLAIASLLGVLAAYRVPRRYAQLVTPKDESGSPPPRGWFALGATLVFIGATATVGIYIQPLAHEAGLSADVARLAVTVSLAAQILGGATATAIAGHIRYLTAFIASSVVIVLSWVVFVAHPPGWGFIAANAVNGFITVFIAPFLVPMTIEADPSRRAAVLSGGAQILASALGPFAASRVVSDANVSGSIVLGVFGLLIGLALIGVLHFTAKRVEGGT